MRALLLDISIKFHVGFCELVVDNSYDSLVRLLRAMKCVRLSEHTAYYELWRTPNGLTFNLMPPQITHAGTKYYEIEYVEKLLRMVKSLIKGDPPDESGGTPVGRAHRS